LRVGGEVLAIDPYFTRIPFRKMWVGRVQSDRQLVAEKMRRCDWVLVTHAHFDHLLDVPEVARQTGATVCGSYNTCRLLTALGVPQRQLREIRMGDQFTLGGFQITALEADHIPTPGFTAGPLPRNLYPPLRARDYRMDGHFCFLVQVEGYRLLTDTGRCVTSAVPADVWFANLLKRARLYPPLLQRVQPRLIVPIHWDNMWRSLSRPVRPLFTPPHRTLRLLPRANLRQWTRMIERMAPDAQVLLPEVFQSYTLERLLEPAEEGGLR